MSRASHYIPKFLLRRFALSKASAEQFIDHRNLGQKHVWAFHKPSDRWAVRAVKRAATLPDYYEPDPALKIEETFAEIESIAAPLIDKVVVGKHVLSEEDECTRALCTFMTLQALRVPGALELSAAVTQETLLAVLDARQHAQESPPPAHTVVAHRGKRPGNRTLGDYKLDLGEGCWVDKRSCWKYVLSPDKIEYIDRTFRGLGWHVLRSAKHGAFVIGDSAVVIADPYAPPEKFAAFSSPTVEVTFPLSTQVCLLGFRKRPDVKERFLDRPATEQEVRILNGRQYVDCVREIFAAKKFQNMPGLARSAKWPLIPSTR